jgi:hypothetical protein
MDDVKALNGPAKYCMFVVQPRLDRVSVIEIFNSQEGALTVFSVVIKNCEPLVFGPAFAMLTV